MKHIYTIACLIIFAVCGAQAQTDSVGNIYSGEIPGDAAAPGEATSDNLGSCSLIKNKVVDKKVKVKGDGIKVETANKEEELTIEPKDNGGLKLEYYSDNESLEYHENGEGKSHYNYSWYENCQYVVVKKDKKGVTHVKNNSLHDGAVMMQRAEQMIQSGLETCMIASE